MSATLPPSRMNASHIRRPRPRDAPVTTATFPSIRWNSCLLICPPLPLCDAFDHRHRLSSLLLNLAHDPDGRCIGLMLASSALPPRRTSLRERAYALGGILGGAHRQHGGILVLAPHRGRQVGFAQTVQHGLFRCPHGEGSGFHDLGRPPSCRRYRTAGRRNLIDAPESPGLV